MKEKRAPLWWLFCINLLISTFTFGGGYVVIPMIRRYFVERRGLLTEEELLDLAAVAQSSPGAIAVNLSVLAGYRTARWRGAVVSCVAAVLPPLVILSASSAGYDAFRANTAVAAVLKGMEAGAAALVVDMVADLCAAVFRMRQALPSLLVPAAFCLSFFLKAPVLWIILGSCAICLGAQLWRRART